MLGLLACLQVLCVFNNSQTARAPLALALSVNDCRTWEPLAIIEEDVKGALAAGSGQLAVAVGS